MLPVYRPTVSSVPPVPTVIATVDPARADDVDLVRRVVDLVNEVYREAEREFWRPGTDRTTPEDVAGYIRRGELVTATAQDRIVGVVRAYDLDDATASFGMLTAAPDQRGTGVGRALLDHIEDAARARGRAEMQLELLVPHEWADAGKLRLDEWYRRRGYRPDGVSSIEKVHPRLGPLLATPCDLVVYRARL